VEESSLERDLRTRDISALLELNGQIFGPGVQPTRLAPFDVEHKVNMPITGEVASRRPHTQLIRPRPRLLCVEESKLI